MPNRMFRDGLLDSDTFNRLTPDEQMAFVRAILAADDAGRLDARSEMIRSKMYPVSSLRNTDADKLMAELLRVKLLLKYEVQGKPIYQIRRWQRCGNASKSKFPNPDGTYTIHYTEVLTRDEKGSREFVTLSLDNSLLDGVPTPCRPHADPMPVNPPTYNEDEKRETKTETKRLSAPKPPPLTWTESGWQNIPDALAESWRKAYPGVNVDGQLAKMHAWMMANPTKRPKSSYARFITNWLSKEVPAPGVGQLFTPNAGRTAAGLSPRALHAELSALDARVSGRTYRRSDLKFSNDGVEVPGVGLVPIARFGEIALVQIGGGA